MFRKVIAIFTIALLVLGLCACDLKDLISQDKDITTSDIDIQDGDKTRTFTVKDYNVSFTVPDDWQVDMEDTELDIFCSNGEVSMGIYGYYTADFADDADYEDLWEYQNESDLERFKNVRKLDHDAEFESDDKELETVVYSAEYGNIKEYLYYVYAAPKEDADVFLWISFGASPSKMRDNFDVIEDIVDSIKFGEINM